ncbi:unnamed protein product [Camellia sinensis]
MSSAAAILKFVDVFVGHHIFWDAEQGTYVPPALEEDGNILNMSKSLNSLEEPRVCKTAGICSYVFQIIYQQQQQQHFKF